MRLSDPFEDADEGLYKGPQSGLAGDETKAALAEAINNPAVKFSPVIKGPLEDPRPLKKPARHSKFNPL